MCGCEDGISSWEKNSRSRKRIRNCEQEFAVASESVQSRGRMSSWEENAQLQARICGREGECRAGMCNSEGECMSHVALSHVTLHNIRESLMGHMRFWRIVREPGAF